MRPFALIASVLLVASFTAQAAPSGLTAARVWPLQALVDTALTLEPELRLAWFLRQLGEPEHVVSEPFQNLHDPTQIDTIKTLYFPDLQLSIYQVRASGLNILIALRVVSPHYSTQQGLRLGSSRREIEQALGPPLVDDGTLLLYHIWDVDPPHELVFWLEQGRVTMIAWQFYWS